MDVVKRTVKSVPINTSPMCYTCTIYYPPCTETLTYTKLLSHSYHVKDILQCAFAQSQMLYTGNKHGTQITIYLLVDKTINFLQYIIYSNDNNIYNKPYINMAPSKMYLYKVI